MSDSGDGAWPLIVVAGPTASGKTALAIRLAEWLGTGGEVGGEIVSCDSVAVYRGMDVGSAKPTVEERARVPHHGLDLYDPDEACTAGDWARAAKAAIAGIRERGRVPIVAGGTGLYLRALLEGLAPAPARDEDLRERLRGIVARRGAAWLHRILRRMDAKAAAAIHANDVPKVIRSVEVTVAARRPQTEQWAEGREGLVGYRVLKLGLAPERKALYERIDGRAAGMFARGLVEETAGLRARYGDECRSLGALGYAQAMAVLRGQMSERDAVVAAQQGHRNYAKRQGTWFRGETGMRWLTGFGDEVEVQNEAVGLVHDFVVRGSWFVVSGSWFVVGGSWSEVEMNGVRMDKWLWAARFFKTRALASKACELGRVMSGEITAKAARDVRVGDVLRVKNEGGEFVVEVLMLSEVRGPATAAAELYRETAESKVARAKVEAERKAMLAMDMVPVGRPSKKDRRQIHKFRGR